MKPGADYENFVYAKLSHLFTDASVKLNDRILGLESGLHREIDVSVRMTVGDTALLYIVQCKDWNSPVDINTLGAFGAVMQDVGAAKGFLLCTSGFYKSNHKYALARGIELVTIEDIKSERWRTEIQIPFVYVKKINEYELRFAIRVNQALAELNCGRELSIDLTPLRSMVRMADQRVLALENYALGRVADHPLKAEDGVKLNIIEPDLEVNVAGVWVPLSELSVTLKVTMKRYLKYLTPTEYSQLRDHVRGTTFPIHARVEGVYIRLDDTFVEMASDAPKAFPGLWLEVEESSVVPTA